ncbi:MAG: hypothetical protein AABX23_01505 [Nanoarchaeota archaeon]
MLRGQYVPVHESSRNNYLIDLSIILLSLGIGLYGSLSSSAGKRDEISNLEIISESEDSDKHLAYIDYRR